MGGSATKEKYVLSVDISASAPSSRGMSKAQSSKNVLDSGSELKGSLKSAPSTSKLRRLPSSSVLPVDPSSRNLIQTHKNYTCSSKVPWIIKSARFSTLSLDTFDVGRVIGTGLMGTVRLVKIKGTNAHLVLKSIRKDYILKHRDERHVVNERAALMTVASSFCIKLFGTFQDSENVYFALEGAMGGELFLRLNKKETFGPETAKFYATEIFSALDHLQSLGFVYRDLKPENVMLDEEGHCKLVDFGFVTRPNSDEKIHTCCGTPAYLSPEQLDGKFTNGYTRIVDWWSFGVFIFELLTGKTPFCKSNKETAYEIYLRILKKKISFPRSMDSLSRDLISCLCMADVNKRLCDPDKIKVHPYFTMDWHDVEERRLVPPFVPRLKEMGDDHYFMRYHDPGLGKGKGGDGGWYLQDF